MAASYAMDVLHAVTPEQERHGREAYAVSIMDNVTRVYELGFDEQEHRLWMLRHGIIHEDNVFNAAERVGRRRPMVTSPIASPGSARINTSEATQFPESIRHAPPVAWTESSAARARPLPAHMMTGQSTHAGEPSLPIPSAPPRSAADMQGQVKQALQSPLAARPIT